MDSEAWLRLMLQRILLPVLLAALSQGTTGLKIITLNMPDHVLTGQSVSLECLYDLEDEPLYSVKWYKDNNEFYRFLPQDDPPKQIFELPGIIVNKNESDSRKVRLDNVSMKSSGIYRCEVSAEAPSFRTVEQRHEMTVYDVPDGGPKISGNRPKYNIGDTVHANCTAVRSKPAAELEWHINGDKASAEILHKYHTMVDSDGLETSVLGLEFTVESRHFQNGDLRLNCTASMGYVYQETAFVQTVLNQLSAAVLESKGTPSQVKITNDASHLGCVVLEVVMVVVVLLR